MSVEGSQICHVKDESSEENDESEAKKNES